MSAYQFQPYQQGELDSLCALYSIVNAVGVAVRKRPEPGSEKSQSLRMRRLADKHADRLFEHLARAADRLVGLTTVLERGIKTPTVGKLLTSADRHLCLRHHTRLLWSKPFHREPLVDPERLVSRLGRHLEAPHTAVVLGYLQHWSTISAVTPGRLVLADSSGDFWLARRGRRGTHARTIWPTSVFLIRLTPIPAEKV